MNSRFRTNANDTALGIILFTLSFVVPGFGVPHVGALFSVSSAVFAIVAGFFIAGGMATYRRLQTLISEENAALISLAELAKRVDKNKANRIREAIDAYMVKQLDIGTLNQYRITQPQVDKLAEAIDTLPKSSAIYDHMQGIKERVLARFQEISLVAKQNLTPMHWVTMILLGALVAISVLGMRDGGLVMNAIAGTMMIVLQAVLVILRDVDDNRLLDRKLACRSPREVFHAIAKPPYYPAFSSADARVPDEHGKYRLGGEAIVMVSKT